MSIAAALAMPPKVLSERLAVQLERQAMPLEWEVTAVQSVDSRQDCASEISLLHCLACVYVHSLAMIPTPPRRHSQCFVSAVKEWPMRSRNR